VTYLSNKTLANAQMRYQVRDFRTLARAMLFRDLLFTSGSVQITRSLHLKVIIYCL